MSNNSSRERRVKAKPVFAISLQSGGGNTYSFADKVLVRPGFTVRLGQDAHGLVEFAVADTLFATAGRPRSDCSSLRPARSSRRGIVQQRAHRLDDQIGTPGRIGVHARAPRTRDEWPGAWNLLVPVRKFPRQQRVGGFALSVTCPFGHWPSSVHGRLELVELDPLRGSALVCDGREHDDADVGTGTFGGLEQEGQKELDEESVGEVVDPELQFVSIFGQSGGVGHDAGVAHQYVQTIRGELVKGGLDRVEGGEMGFQERDVHIWGGGLDVGRDGFATDLVAAGGIDLGRLMPGKLEDRRCTNSSGPW